ncbi:MAG: phosphotransferase [Microlunatus sp.]
MEPDAMAQSCGRSRTAAHRTPVPAGSQWRRPSWLAGTLAQPDRTAAQEFWSRADEPELLAPILDNTAALWKAIKAPADCFLHGDCHTDNILIDDNELVWTDWQGAGAGNPSVELAFPSIRATPAGAVLPQAEMIRRYALTRGLDENELSRAVLAAELSIFLFVWPEYARYNTEVGIDRVHERVQDLARRWLSVCSIVSK